MTQDGCWLVSSRFELPRGGAKLLAYWQVETDAAQGAIWERRGDHDAKILVGMG